MSSTNHSSGSLHYDTHSLAKGVSLFWNTCVNFELSDINSSDKNGRLKSCSIIAEQTLIGDRMRWAEALEQVSKRTSVWESLVSDTQFLPLDWLVPKLFSGQVAQIISSLCPHLTIDALISNHRSIIVRLTIKPKQIAHPRIVRRPLNLA